MATIKYLDQAGLSVLWSLINNKFQALKYGTASQYSDDYVPKNGQICLVNTENAGIQIKIGDGSTKWSSLEYYNQGTDIIVRGYYQNGQFFYDNILTKPIAKMAHKLYIDLNADKIYIYESSQFVCLNSIPVADASTAGVMKLYSATGTNTDGTMTQKSISEALATKVGAKYEGEALVLE